MIMNKESIIYSLRNLRHSKSRSILTILSIFVGIATIFIFISFGLGLVSYTEQLKTDSTVNKVNIQPKGVGAPGSDDTFALTEKDLEAVDKTTGVSKSSGVYFKPVEIKKGDSLRFVWGVGYDSSKPLVIDMLDVNIYRGRSLRPGDSGKVVLGYNYLLEKKIFDRGLDVNDNVKIQDKDFKVVGFYEPVGNPQDDSNVYIVDDDLKELYGDIKGFSWIIAEVDVEEIDQTVERIEKALRKSRGLDEGKEDFFVQSFDDLLEQFNTVLLFITGFIIAIAFVSVLVSAINTANTMVTSTLERVKEIGVIKSIGAKNSDVFNIFLFESGFLGLIAGIVGIIVGFLITYIISRFLVSAGYGFLSPDYSVWLFVGLILFATLTGALSGVWPAWQASKVRPVTALRYE